MRSVTFVFAMLLGATALTAQEATWQVGLVHAGAFETGGPFSVVQSTSFGSLELEASRPILRGGAWHLDFVGGVLPLAWVRNTSTGNAWPLRLERRWQVSSDDARVTSRGWGLRPLGLRGVWGRRTIAFESDATVGALFFPVPTPARNSSRVNLTASVGAGLRMTVPGAHLAVGYRLHHLSNAGWGRVNPGVDSHMVYFGFWVH